MNNIYERSHTRVNSAVVDSVTSSQFRETAKRSLLERLDDSKDDIYVCPVSLAPLTRCERYIGILKLTYFQNPVSGVKYEITPKYSDLTIKDETEKPLWKQSFKEIFNSRFFQTSFISSIYERGYRQNFKNFGFPGVEKEFDEATELFDAVNATTIMDLSCGSGTFSLRCKVKHVFDLHVLMTVISQSIDMATVRLCSPVVPFVLASI